MEREKGNVFFGVVLFGLLLIRNTEILTREEEDDEESPQGLSFKDMDNSWNFSV